MFSQKYEGLNQDIFTKIAPEAILDIIILLLIMLKKVCH
jgi:hypothetical protein